MPLIWYAFSYLSILISHAAERNSKTAERNSKTAERNSKRSQPAHKRRNFFSYINPNIADDKKSKRNDYVFSTWKTDKVFL